MRPATNAAPQTKKANAPAKGTGKGAGEKPAQRVTITLKQLAAPLAEMHGLAKRQVEALLSELVAVTTEHLRQGSKVRMTGLGTLQVRALPARTGRNPATGATIQIAASKKIAFQAAKELKESV